MKICLVYHHTLSYDTVRPHQTNKQNTATVCIIENSKRKTETSAQNISKTNITQTFELLWSNFHYMTNDLPLHTKS